MTECAAVQFLVSGNVGCKVDEYGEPAFVRVVGCLDGLGRWDPQRGRDLLWEGNGWRSLLIDVPLDRAFDFALVRVSDDIGEDGPKRRKFPGTKLTRRRTFAWGPTHRGRVVCKGQVLTISLDSLDAKEASRFDTSARIQHVAFPLPGQLPRVHLPGSQRSYTFDFRPKPEELDVESQTLNFCLWKPPGHAEATDSEGWPLLVFFHSLHGSLDSDTSILRDSCVPSCLLREEGGRCPQLLRERFVVLCPQCPEDPAREDGSGVWLVKGYEYEDISRHRSSSAALASLIENVVQSCRIDRRRICASGISIGGFACLELALQWPSFFSCAAPVAAYHDGVLEKLADNLPKTCPNTCRKLLQERIEKLAKNLSDPKTALPLWFFHATNDSISSFEPMERLACRLRDAAEQTLDVRMTSFEDTWSSNGHLSERVVYPAVSDELGRPAFGADLFAWMLTQRRSGKTSCANGDAVCVEASTTPVVPSAQPIDAKTTVSA